ISDLWPWGSITSCARVSSTGAWTRRTCRMSETLKSTLSDKAAVLAGLPDHPALKTILAWNADALVDARFDRAELTLTIAQDHIRAAAATVLAAGYHAFQDVTAVDWYPSAPRFQLSYHIVSHSLKERIRLAVRLNSADLTLDSITSVWASP